MTFVEFAKLRGKSKGWVSHQIAAGMPVLSRGRNGNPSAIHPATAIDWEVEHARVEAAPKPGSQRERLAKEQADKLALENAKRRSELVLASYVSEIFNGLAADISARLDGLPGRVANELAGITDPAQIRSRLLDECRAIRSGVAGYCLQLANTPPDVEHCGDDLVAAQTKKPERVGRRQPGVTTRKCRARSVAQ